jgi:F0F1-type ATP synthase epsilon subunit
MQWNDAANNRFSVIVSGGFAVVQPDSQLSINAVEGFPLEDFSADVCSDPPLRQHPRIDIDLTFF